jgi:hypothetical protein
MILLGYHLFQGLPVLPLSCFADQDRGDQKATLKVPTQLDSWRRDALFSTTILYETRLVDTVVVTNHEPLDCCYGCLSYAGLRRTHHYRSWRIHILCTVYPSLEAALLPSR